MQRHFLILLIGSLLFALLFLVQTRFLPHTGVEGAILATGVVIRNAIRLAFLYAVFLILVFGHYVFKGVCAQGGAKSTSGNTASPLSM